jgi:hypothetical protein
MAIIRKVYVSAIVHIFFVGHTYACNKPGGCDEMSKQAATVDCKAEEKNAHPSRASETLFLKSTVQFHSP